MAMNYFELFNLPVRFKINSAGLHQRFIALSRQYHPDYFAKDGQEKLAEVQEMSATINKAYRTFQDPDATINYVLQLKGLLEEEEKYQLPPAFLMEVLDINERVMELAPDTGEPAIAGQQAARELQAAINNLQAESYEPVKKIMEGYQEGVTTQEELLQVKEYYYKKKYLDRIRRELGGKL